MGHLFEKHHEKKEERKEKAEKGDQPPAEKETQEQKGIKDAAQAAKAEELKAKLPKEVPQYTHKGEPKLDERGKQIMGEVTAAERKSMEAAVTAVAKGNTDDFQKVFAGPP